MVEDQMSSAREDILAAIRKGTRTSGRGVDEEYGAIERRYRRDSSLTRADLIDLFTSRIVHYDGNVRKCGAEELPAVLGEMLAARGKTRIDVPQGIPSDWLPSNVDFARDQGSAATEFEGSQGALTGCSVAIATTGTIILMHGPREGRRALTLVPDYHLTVVFAEQIVETVPEAISRVAPLSPPLVTTISGPSATSDIEMTRIKGVHGPRALDVVVVLAGAAANKG
jgi:L-lactate dehydrogenase complex protein LldG